MICYSVSSCEDNYKSQHDTGILLRDRILSALGYNPSEIVFSKTEIGKPYAENADFEFSVSHSKNLAMCAVNSPLKADNLPDFIHIVPLGGKGVGADIEAISDKSAERLIKLSERYLHKHTENKNDFFKLWTRRESFGKLVGTGVFNAPTDESGAIFHTFVTECDGNKYSAAICTMENFT